MDKLLKIMQEMKPGIDFMKEDNLIDDGILGSLEIMTLVVEICDTYEIEITPMDIVPENFKSIHTIDALIRRAKDED